MESKGPRFFCTSFTCFQVKQPRAVFRQALRGTVQEEKDLIFRKSGVAWLRFVFRTEGGKHNDFEKDLCMDVYLKPTCTP